MGKNWVEENKPLLAMLVLQFIYATSSLAAKAALTQGVGPMVFIVYRQVFATIALAPATILGMKRGQGRATLGMKGFSLVFFASLIGVTFYQVLYYQGLNLSSASLGCAVTNIVPAVTFAMAVCLGLEKVRLNSARSMAKIMGTIICVGGAIFIVLVKGPMLMSVVTPQENWMLGGLYLFGSSCCWSLLLILQVPICKDYLDPLSLSSWMCLLSSLQSAAFTLFLEPNLNAWKLNSTFELLCCIYAVSAHHDIIRHYKPNLYAYKYILLQGVIGSGVAFYLQSWCISRKGPLFTAMFNPLCTVIATILSIILLNEHLYYGSLFGAFAVVVGLYVVLWGKAKDIDDSTITKMPLSIDEEKESFQTDIREPLLDDNSHIAAEIV